MTPIHLRENIWGIEVPTMALGLMINNYADESELMYMLSMEDISDGSDSEETLITKKLPPGSWQIICLSKDVTEEQAKEIVENVGVWFDLYPDYEEINGDGFDMSLLSFHSLLRSKGLDPERTLILKKQ